MPFENLCHKTHWEQGIFSLSCPPTYLPTLSPYLLQSLVIEAMKPKTLHDAYACFVFLQFCFYTPLYHS